MKSVKATEAVTYLASWRLSEPQCPFVHQRMLDGEVLWVMEDSNGLAVEGRVWVDVAVCAHCAVW